MSAEDISKTIIELARCDDYGNRSSFLDAIERALKGDKARVLARIVDEYSLSATLKKELLKKAADLSGDIDCYIKVTKTGQISDDERFQIAERLLNAKRFKEAISWLNGAEDLSYYKNYKKEKLLRRAYKALGEKATAFKLGFLVFEKTCDINLYEDLQKESAESEREHIKKRSIKTAEQLDDLSLGARFLSEIKEFSRLEELILKWHTDIKDTDYSTYRRLSTDLNKNSYSLSATLLRRKLIVGILKKAQSKYYKYAASDYKKALEYGVKVKDWQGFDDIKAYKEVLKEEHGKKKAFWALISWERNRIKIH